MSLRVAVQKFKKPRVVSVHLKRLAYGLEGMQKMVGTARFELATSRTPSVRATRLRYVPTGELTTTRQESRGPNRGSNCNFKAITAVRAASRKRAGYRANPAAFCGSATVPCLQPRDLRFPPRNLLHARAESAARPPCRILHRRPDASSGRP